MQSSRQIAVITTLIILLLSTSLTYADELSYKCEFGLQGGMSYYAGDATPHIFQNPQYAAGLQFRYKFTPRWALQVKGQWQQIKFPAPDEQGTPLTGKDNLLTNQILNFDALAEFNFFRFGGKQYDSRIKPITPYIFLGIGMGVYNDYSKVGAYFPFGFGMKWKFAPRWGLNIAWQHQLFFADNLENEVLYDNYPTELKMNGSNIFKNDLTSTLTLGIVFEFAKERAVCRRCK